jgi:dihydrofolate reductase
VNDLERPIGTYLYGRRLYDVMVPWETIDTADAARAVEDYAGIWRSADKVVYSRTLDQASSARTLIERDFDPDAVRRMKAESTRDLSIGGPALAAAGFAAALVDEIRLFLTPVVVGGGTRSMPVGVRLSLELLGERRFRSGVVHVRYRVAR